MLVLEVRVLLLSLFQLPQSPNVLLLGLLLLFEVLLLLVCLHVRLTLNLHEFVLVGLSGFFHLLHEFVLFELGSGGYQVRFVKLFFQLGYFVFKVL